MSEMKQKEDDKWVKKWKERLDDYAEPTPVDGWEKLEQELQAGAPLVAGISPSEEKRISLIPFRKWAAVAAVALLLLISSLASWLMKPSVGELSGEQRMVQNRVPATSALELTAEQEKSSTAIQLGNSAGRVAAETLDTHAGRTAESGRKSLRNGPVESVVSSAFPLKDTSEASLKVSTQDEQDEQNNPDEQAKRVAARRTSERRAASLLAANGGSESYSSLLGRRAARKSWSVGVSVSSSGGATESVSSTTPSYMRVSMISLNNSILSAPVEGNPSIGQIPYTYRVSDYLDVKHRQPVTLGISVRKHLKYGFSVETGLTYTLLASDVKLSGMQQSIEQCLHYVGIPLRGNWNFWENKRWTTYISAGVLAEKCVYGKLGGEKEIVDPLQFSVNGAVGAQYNATEHFGIYFEPGVSYFFDNGSQVPTLRGENPLNINLQAGFRFTY